MIWASPFHIILAIWVRIRVRVTGNARITTVLGMGMFKTWGSSYHCKTGREKRERLFTINKKFPENPVGKKIEHDLIFGQFGGKFPGEF